MYLTGFEAVVIDIRSFHVVVISTRERDRWSGTAGSTLDHHLVVVDVVDVFRS